MSSHSKLRLNQSGAMNILLIPLILVVCLFIAAFSFAMWAFMSRQDYKNNVDAKIKTAVEVATKETETKKDNEFLEKEKSPFATYQGPSAAGSIVLKYPKTWSAYAENNSGNKEVDAYFYPTQVPGKSSGSAYALRVEVVNQEFSNSVKSFDGFVKRGVVKTKPFTAKNVSGVVGLRIDGEIASRRQGIMILMPLRDKTIKIYTESNQFYNDFNKNILPSLSFNP